MCKRILVVENDPDIRNHLVKFFNDEGFATDFAKNGLEALNFLTATLQLPDVITLDLKMPVMGGWEFRIKQKEIENIKNIPVVVLSAESIVSKPIGADAVVQKPIDLDILLDIVKKLCNV